MHAHLNNYAIIVCFDTIWKRKPDDAWLIYDASSVSDGALNISRVMNQICMSHSQKLFYENTKMKDEMSVHDGN